MALSASDLPAIYSLLTNSMSGDESVRKPAEAALSQSESRPGFCSCLMEVITAKDLASQVDVRLLASVYFKNSINRYWRNRRDSSGISSEEKNHLRQRLLSHLREENDKIAVMLAVLISKIARFDYPKEWPELFSVLAHQLQSADVLTSHRIFTILFRTLKELSTKRLTADQRNFAEISSHFFDYCWRLWQSDVQTILHGFSAVVQSYNPNALEQRHDELYLTSERWLLCLKIIRQLIVSGFQSDAKCIQEVRPVKEVSPMFLNAIQSLLPYYSSFQKGHPQFWDFIKRACTKLMKVLVTIQGRHPYSFGDKSVLPPVMDFCLNKIVDPEPDLLLFEPFLIQCMVMVKCVLECKEYKPILTGRVMDENAITLEQMKKNISSVVGGVLTSLLPSERLILVCNILIRRYFVLTASDLEEWYQYPETFHHEQDVVQWTEKLRPCAEALYIVLFENYSQLLGPVVVSILQEAMNGCPSSVTEVTPGLLLKDAAYGAAAYVYYELSNYLSFKDWFNGALSLELSNDHPNMRIIHRKVALILGQWVSEIKDDIKRPVYCGLIRLLQDRDLSVRLAACRSLCSHIEDANFSEKDFGNLLPVCWDSCFKLIEEVQEFDSKVQVLNLISVLIAHISKVIPFANKLVEFFQKVWEESSGESLLQIQLLIALRNFVVALGYQSPSCYNVLLPILQKGIDINSPDELNLLEDSMLLWEATLSHAPAMVPQLLTYFPCLVEIIERSFDHLQVSVNIIESYIILGGTEFLNMHASSVAKLLDLIVGNVNDKGLLSTLPVIDILIQCFPVEVPPLISSTLQKLIVICLSGGDDLDPAKTAVKASSAAILARILVMNTNYLGQLTAEPSLQLLLQQAGAAVEESILLCLVDIWLDKVDNASSYQRKLFGFALSIILTLRLPQVLDKLDQILSGDNMGSSMSHGEGIVPSKEFRKRQIKISDPINQLSLENSVRENLQTCAALHGESFNSAISRMHPSAFAQLKQALKMP
ncbi:importin-11 isoform X2 [Manihot esculenta]|uniref:importin-11 isoform X2 n=1 Tax=Manihot esculenta TaxID=3983 RepID=UPI001CC36589|nr:importin-11 isoform X2 [Manihot esculenta]